MVIKFCVCKLPKLDSASFFITHTKWDDQEFNISIFDKELVWTGQFTKQDVLKASKTLGLSLNEYWAETRLALTTNCGADRFQYFISEKCFKWLKLIKKDTEEKMEYGSVVLEPGPLSQFIETVIDCLIDTNICLAAQIKSTEEEKSMLESDKQRLVETLHHHRSEKQAMEELLYSNFLDILNAKKLKIAALQENETDSRAVTKPSSPKASTSRAKPTTWRKTIRSQPVKKTKSKQLRTFLVDSDSSNEQDCQFELLRKSSRLRDVKRKVSTEKPMPVVESMAVVNDEYDGDTDIDDTPDIVEVLNKSATKSLAVERPKALETEHSDEGKRTEVKQVVGSPIQLAEMSRSQLREFNTQKLLDDLGI